MSGWDDMDMEKAKELPGVIETIADYLQWMSVTQAMQKIPPLHGWAGGYYEWLLKYGMKFTWKPTPDDVPKGTVRQCFSNAYELASERPQRFIYCEGFAAGMIPTNHAWCFDLETDAVVDNTWMGDDPDEKNTRDYFGIPFDLTFVTQTIFDRDCYGVIDNYQRRWPILTMPVEQFWDESVERT